MAAQERAAREQRIADTAVSLARFRASQAQHELDKSLAAKASGHATTAPAPVAAPALPPAPVTHGPESAYAAAVGFAVLPQVEASKRTAAQRAAEVEAGTRVWINILKYGLTCCCAQSWRHGTAPRSAQSGDRPNSSKLRLRH